MAVTSRQDAQTRQVSRCPGCGNEVAGVRYCPECGHAIPLPPRGPAPAAEQSTQPIPAVRPDAAASARSGRSRLVPFAALVALLAAIAAILIIVLSSGSSSPSAPPQGYRQKLATALAPVLAANRTVSLSLQSISGSKATVVAATNATAQAQTALTAATGALGVITVPASEQTLSQQAQQALTEENGYLKALAAALVDPAGQGSTQLRALATSTQAAFVPLSVVSPDAPASIGGIDNLIAWVSGATAASQHAAAAAQRKAIKQAATQATHTTTVIQAPPPSAPVQSAPVQSTYVTPSGSAVPGTWYGDSAAFAQGTGTPYAWSSVQQCDQNIVAGGGGTCSFANNIFMVVAAADHYANFLPGTITAPNPADGTSETVTCTEYTGTDGNADLQCVTTVGAGTAFPVWAANVYYG